MVRKWSYINTLSHYSPSCKPQTNTYLRYTLKTFRKNTRFKNFNQGNTLFVRKLAILKQRRVGWKGYFHLSSIWVKHVLNLKKTINYVQSKLLYNITLSYPYVNMLTRKSNLNSLIGMGNISINYFYVSKNFWKALQTSYTLKNSYTSPLLLLPSVQFNKLSTPKKLSSLGFTFTNVSFLSTQLPLKNQHVSTENLLISNNLLPKTVLKQVLSIKTTHLYLVLYLVLGKLK